MNVCLLKNIYLSRDFVAILEVKVLGKVLIQMFARSVQIISCLFFGLHDSVLRKNTNIAAPYWAL